MTDALGYIEHLQADALERFDRHYDHWFAFPQTHSDTSLGFGGMAGQMVTTAQTVILTDGHSRAAVYFGGRFAYEATYQDAVEYTRALHAPTRLQRARTRSTETT